MGRMNDLRHDLSSYSSIVIDTMVFVYLLEAHPTYGPLAGQVLEALEAGEFAGAISTVTLTEILTAPAQANDAAAMLDYEMYLLHFPNLSIHPLDIEIAREAAWVRARTGLPTPDSIVLATAYALNAEAIVTNDKRWRQKIKDKTLLLLADYVEE